MGNENIQMDSVIGLLLHGANLMVLSSHPKPILHQSIERFLYAYQTLQTNTSPKYSEVNLKNKLFNSQGDLYILHLILYLDEISQAGLG